MAEIEESLKKGVAIFQGHVKVLKVVKRIYCERGKISGQIRLKGCKQSVFLRRPLSIYTRQRRAES